MTNESAILGILAQLYQDRGALQAENQRLHHTIALLEAKIAELAPPGDDGPLP